MSRTTVTIGLAFAAVLLAAASASAQTTTSSEDWNKIVAAGKSEGKVIYYTAHVGNPLQKAILQAFTTRYGIAVESLEARASELRERTRVEQAAGRFVADVTF